MKVKDLAELVRASVRPMITFVFTILIAIMFFKEMVIPELLQWTWLAIIAEWFTERAVGKAFSAIKTNIFSTQLPITKEEFLQTVEKAISKMVARTGE